MNEQKKYTVSIGVMLIVICGLLWLMGILFFVNDPMDLTEWLLVFLYIYGIWSVMKRNGGRIYPFAIFLLYCFVSNAGQTISHMLGIENTGKVDIYTQYTGQLINRMLIQQCVFVLCMILGYLLLRRLKAVTIWDDPVIQKYERVTFGPHEILLWVLALYVVVIYLQELSQRAVMDYGEYYYETRQGIGTVAEYLYHVVIFAYLFKYTGWKRKMAFGIMLTLAAMAVLIGSRSSTIPVIVGVCFLLSYQTKKKFKLRLWHVLAGIVVLLVFSAFAKLREYPISEISFSLLRETVTLNPIKALAEILQEMGTSARTTLSTMIALDKGVVEHEGTIIYALLKGVFPIQLLNMVGIDPPAMESLSAWVSDYGAGQYVDGRGWGYSFIGEIIYNFGNWGFIFSFFFGTVVALLENGIERLLKKKDFYLSAGILYVLGYSVFLARAEMVLLSTRIRYTVYMAVAFMLVKNLFKEERVKGQ